MRQAIYRHGRVFGLGLLTAATAYLLMSGAMCGFGIRAQADFSESGVWKYAGPDGVRAEDIAIGPSSSSTLYVTSGYSLFRSVDGGSAWKKMFSRAGWCLGGLVVDPTTATILYMIVPAPPPPYVQALCRSTDGGATWRILSGGNLTRSTWVECVAIDPTCPNTLYIGTDEDGVLKSTDGGLAWFPASSGIGEDYAGSLAINPVDPAIVYAGAGTTVYKTTNGGASWAEADQGIPEGDGVGLLYVAPSNPEVLYGVGDSCVYRTTDGGAHWKPAGLRWPRIESLTVDPSTPDIVYAVCEEGLFMTTDGGKTWARLGGLPKYYYYLQALAVDPLTPATIYAGTNEGVMKSTNRGVTWSPRNRGMRELSAWSIAVDPSQPDTVHAGTGWRVVSSKDGGKSWRTSNANGREYPSFRYLAFDPMTPTTVYASMNDLWKSTDGGAHWKMLREDIGNLAIDPTNPATMYGGVETNVSSILRSTDGGVHWEKRSEIPDSYSGIIQELVVDPNTPTTLYVGHGKAGCLRSTDAGLTWDWMGVGWGRYYYGWSVAVDASTPGTVYASEGLAVWKSTDGGNRWKNIGLAWRDPTSLFVPPNTPGTVYASVSDSPNPQVYCSTDGGATWAAANEGMPATVEVYMLAASPAAPRRLYAATDGGIYRFCPSGP